MNYREFDEEEAVTMIQEALKKGINYIDTAPYYGQGRSEEILGKVKIVLNIGLEIKLWQLFFPHI